MEVEDKLVQKKKAIDTELERLLSRGNSLLSQAMRYAVLSGGKRFRPLLALSSGECFGVDQDVILPFACAVELIHNYSLIHDDLPSMDNDDFRRGKPSCHKAFGENIALLAGDGLLSLSFEVLALTLLDKKLILKKEHVIKEISYFAGAEGMIGGQLLDITLSPEKVSEEKLYELMLKKTGSLIIASVKAGSILGDASPSQLEAILNYGKNIGLAFQIRDDIIDSAEAVLENHLSRPNSVSLFGIEEAEIRLKHHVDAGIRALDKASLESDELRFLASKLLSLKEKNENEQDA
ncbi:MAG: polyprenyl synthetase family protein [Candidatus Aminicenantes bacterium]|nr:polyprenyl synthetase family protein [Candidatus Aminicenantes bacterium]